MITTQEVKSRLKKAAITMRKLPSVKTQGYFNAWPEIIYSEKEIMRMDQKFKKQPATPEEVSLMEESCNWLLLLEKIEDRKLVWMRANNRPWQIICQKFGFSRVTANKRWQKSLLIITNKLL